VKYIFHEDIFSDPFCLFYFCLVLPPRPQAAFILFKPCLFHSPPASRKSACPAPVRSSTKELPLQLGMALCNAPRDASASSFRATPPVPSRPEIRSALALAGLALGHKPHAQRLPSLDQMGVHRLHLPMALGMYDRRNYRPRGDITARRSRVLASATKCLRKSRSTRLTVVHLRGPKFSLCTPSPGHASRTSSSLVASRRVSVSRMTQWLFCS
jgi:hypothetical protein